MYVLKKLEVKSFELKGIPKVSALPSLVNATMQEIEEYVSWNWDSEFEGKVIVYPSIIAVHVPCT